MLVVRGRSLVAYRIRGSGVSVGVGFICLVLIILSDEDHL